MAPKRRKANGAHPNDQLGCGRRSSGTHRHTPIHGSPIASTMTHHLYLLSHASTPALRTARFPTDEGLDPDGAKKAAAMVVTRAGVDASWCGTDRRTRETATALGCSPVAEPRLDDLDVRRWRGQTPEEVARTEPEAFAEWIQNPDAAPHGGESLRGLVERASGWLDSQLEIEGRTVAVTHPAFIRAALVHILQSPIAKFWAIDVPPLAVIRIDARGARWSIRLPASE